MKRAKYILGFILIILGIAMITYPIERKQQARKIQKNMIENLEQKVKSHNPKVVQSDEITPSNPHEKVEIEENGSNKLLEKQEVVGLIEIPKLELFFAIVEGTERYNLSVAIGHMKETAALGQKGNCVLAGHRGGIYGDFFKEIHKLEMNDSVYITDKQKVKYEYKVYEQFLVKPTEQTVIQNVGEESTLTLITCEQNGKMRRIVRCRLK